jgi:hypothetical protein
VFTVDMALLTEGGIISPGVYKHLPPDGGKMSKLARQTEVCRTSLVCQNQRAVIDFDNC